MNGDARYIVLLGLSSPADAVLCESCVWDNRHVTYVADSILGWRKTADAPVEGANRHRSRRAILRATAAVIAPSGRRMVSTERTLVPGCRVQPLGVMRYVPVASQTFIEQHLPDGFTAHAVMKAPSLAWNQDDALQDMMVRKVFRHHILRPTYFVPAPEGFAAAVRAGLWWGMFPEKLAVPALADGSFIRISDVTSTCRCSGNAGHSTARLSAGLEKRCGQLPQICAGTKGDVDGRDPKVVIGLDGLSGKLRCSS